MLDWFLKIEWKFQYDVKNSTSSYWYAFKNMSKLYSKNPCLVYCQDIIYKDINLLLKYKRDII